MSGEKSTDYGIAMWTLSTNTLGSTQWQAQVAKKNMSFWVKETNK